VAEREEGAQPPEPDGVPERPSKLDEDAAWAELVAAYDDEPAPGTGSWPAAEDLARDPDSSTDAAGADAEDGESDGEDREDGGKDAPTAAPTVPVPARSIVVHPVITGPRDYGLDDEDEGHFVPPEPPPLPEADVTTKFAWIAVLGGPLLIFAFILLQQELPWWAITVGVGGFLGGFATLVARMRPGGDEDDDLPGGGAVV
jgi:hypothetical protein